MKTKLIIACAALLVAAFAFCLRSCRNADKANRITQIAKAAQDTGTRRRDANNIEHLAKDAQVGTYKELAVFSKRQMDSAVKSVGIQRRQLGGVTNVDVEVSGTAQVPLQTITIHDTIHGFPVGWQGNYFNYEDSFAVITGYVDIEHYERCPDSITGGSDSCLVPGKATIFWRNDVPVTVVEYWKPKHKFLWFIRRRKIIRTDVSSKNPNARITNFTSLKVRE